MNWDILAKKLNFGLFNEALKSLPRPSNQRVGGSIEKNKKNNKEINSREEKPVPAAKPENKEINPIQEFRQWLQSKQKNQSLVIQEIKKLITEKKELEKLVLDKQEALSKSKEDLYKSILSLELDDNVELDNEGLKKWLQEHMLELEDYKTLNANLISGNEELLLNIRKQEIAKQFIANLEKYKDKNLTYDLDLNFNKCAMTQSPIKIDFEKINLRQTVEQIDKEIEKINVDIKTIEKKAKNTFEQESITNLLKHIDVAINQKQEDITSQENLCIAHPVQKHPVRVKINSFAKEKAFLELLSQVLVDKMESLPATQNKKIVELKNKLDFLLANKLFLLLAKTSYNVPLVQDFLKEKIINAKGRLSNPIHQDLHTLGAKKEKMTRFNWLVKLITDDYFPVKDAYDQGHFYALADFNRTNSNEDLEQFTLGRFNEDRLRIALLKSQHDGMVNRFIEDRLLDEYKIDFLVELSSGKTFALQAKSSKDKANLHVVKSKTPFIIVSGKSIPGLINELKEKFLDQASQQISIKEYEAATDIEKLRLLEKSLKL